MYSTESRDTSRERTHVRERDERRWRWRCVHSGASGRRSACSVCAPAVSRDACSHDRVALAGGWRRAAHIRLSRHSARPADKSERVKYVSLESGSKTGTRAPRRLEWKANSTQENKNQDNHITYGTARRATPPAPPVFLFHVLFAPPPPHRGT